MRTILVISMLLIAVNANAEWYYLINKDEKVVAVQNGPAKVENLEKDGLFQVKSDTLIDLAVVEYRNNKLSEHKKTTSEINAEKAKDDIKVSVVNKLKALGLTDDEINILKD